MSSAITGSEALMDLQKNLNSLSKTLSEISSLLRTDMTRVGDAWQDGKYQQFVDGYEPYIRKCDEISTRYEMWCRDVLDQTIVNVKAVEETDVSGGGHIGGSVGGGSVGADSSGMTAAYSSYVKSDMFNM